MEPVPGPGVRWFVPFALVLAIVTLPLTLRDPLFAAPFVLAAAGIAAGVWHAERPEGVMGAMILVQAAVLAGLGVVLLAMGMS